MVVSTMWNPSVIPVVGVLVGDEAMSVLSVLLVVCVGSKIVAHLEIKSLIGGSRFRGSFSEKSIFMIS